MTTEAKRQEMRKWAAGLMKWPTLINTWTNKPFYFDPHNKQFLVQVIDYQPDSPDAPAWQILGVIKEMRRRGWYLSLELLTTGLIEAAFIYKVGALPNRGQRQVEYDYNFQIAILKAGMATGEK